MSSSLKLKGLGQVFRFTLAQFLKQKGNIVAMVLLFIFITALGPVMALMTGEMEPAMHDDPQLGAAMATGNAAGGGHQPGADGGP